jgi:ribonuclease HI
MEYDVTVHTDGGARGNPGPAGIGYVIKLPDGTEVTHGAVIGNSTNNIAEYTALRAALEKLLQLQAEGVNWTGIRICLDSELVVRQVTGVYRTKEAHLKNQFLAVKSQLEQLTTPYKLVHVPRAHNAHADRLVNQALDSAGIPSSII